MEWGSRVFNIKGSLKNLIFRGEWFTKKQKSNTQGGFPKNGGLDSWQIKRGGLANKRGGAF